MSDKTPETPETPEAEFPEVIAHTEEEEAYPCSGNCTQLALD